MKKIVTSIIFIAIVLVFLQNVYGGSNRPCPQAHDKVPAIARGRNKIDTPVKTFDPDNILASKKQLHLTKRQIRKLRAINKASRQNAKEVLTDKQRHMLVLLGKLTCCSEAVDKMCHCVMEHLQIHESKTCDSPAAKAGLSARKCPDTGGDLGGKARYSVGDCDGYVPNYGLGYGIYNYYPYPAIPYNGSYGYYGLRGYGLYHGTYRYGFGFFGGN
jgi:hypothetical protein